MRPSFKGLLAPTPTMRRSGVLPERLDSARLSKDTFSEILHHLSPCATVRECLKLRLLPGIEYSPHTVSMELIAIIR